MNIKTTSVQIVAAGLPDLERLRQLSIDTFLQTFATANSRENMEQYLAESRSEARLREELQTEGSAFYFAMVDDTPAGYLKVNTGAAQTEPDQGESLEIERIYITEQYQGLRIGQRLMEKALELAAAQGKRFVWLGVWEHNHKAIRFYQKYGFEAFGKHVFRLGDDEQTDILMKVPVR